MATIKLAKRIALTLGVLAWAAQAGLAQRPRSGAARSRTARYSGAAWHLKGEGVVCCPCAVPCPCRRNGSPSYGHCEATLYLRVRQGRHDKVSLDGLQVVDTSGACGMSYEKLAAIYAIPGAGRIGAGRIDTAPGSWYRKSLRVSGEGSRFRYVAAEQCACRGGGLLHHALESSVLQAGFTRPDHRCRPRRPGAARPGHR